jgi:hypothetical protein
MALAALAAVCLWRVKSASVKHAVWSMVTAGMLLQMLLGPMLPPLPLPVLRPVEFSGTTVLVTNVPTSALPSRPHFPLIPVVYCAGALFFAARLLRAFFFTRRLIRRSEPIDSSDAPGRNQSREIAVPLTVGSKILLPLDWADWDAAKLRAVLAHEEAHVRRRDSLVALLARLNRCVFWFHPLAWWLERHLTQLAEQACDDAALLAVQDRQQYAQTLLDMARAVHVSNGRFLTAGMAKEANVETRINRILDETRNIPNALSRLGWTALLACMAPPIYLATAVQLAPAQTLMSVHAPAAPEPPVMIAQAAPPPVPPAPAPPAPAQAVEAAPAPAPAPQAQPDDSPKSISKEEILDRFKEVQRLPKPPDSIYRVWIEIVERLKAELEQPPKISIAFSPLRSGVITIPLGDPVEHQVNAQIFAGGGFVTSADQIITGSNWEMPVSLKPGMYELIVTIKTGNMTAGSRLGFNVE